MVRDLGDDIAIYVKDLTSGARFAHNAETPMYLASTVKVPVLIAVYRAIARGTLSLDDEIVIAPEDVRDGSPVLRGRGGNVFNVGQLVRVMMTRSDNGATDVLIRRVGIDAVEAALRETGIAGFHRITTMLDVRRNIYAHADPEAAKLEASQYLELREAEDLPERGKLLAKMLGRAKPFSRAAIEEAFDAYYATELNSASMQAMGELLELMARGRVVSAEASRAMLQVMKTCETGAHRLRAHLPAHVALAHKTGTQHRRVCDVGVMELTREHQVVVAVCVKNRTMGAAERAIAAVGRAVYETVSADPYKASPSSSATTASAPVGAPR